jgi:hypothetical protein
VTLLDTSVSHTLPNAVSVSEKQSSIKSLRSSCCEDGSNLVGRFDEEDNRG